VPGDGVEIDRVEERPVQIEDSGLCQIKVLRGVATVRRHRLFTAG
jgi:hypothetical protein